MDLPKLKAVVRERFQQPDGKYLVRACIGIAVVAVYSLAVICDGSGWRILAEGTWSRPVARNFGAIGLVLFVTSGFGMMMQLIREGLAEIGRNRNESKEEGFGITPDGLGKLLGYLVPRKIRKACFEPFLEDLKVDRLEKIAATRSRVENGWIEFCFYLRLAVTVLQSLVCYLGDLLAKIAPYLRALIFKSGF
jgi:hypothetical protein